MAGYATSLNDIFTDIQAAGQSLIDEGASAVGIEKGGTIDTLVTKGANIAKDATGVSTVDGAINKAIGVATGGPGSPPQTATAQAAIPETGSAGIVSRAAGKINPTWGVAGTVVGGGLGYYFTRSIWGSIGIGLGSGILTGVAAHMLQPRV